MNRDTYMDNLRAILITLVVIAHFLTKLISFDELEHLYYFIYTFHMPLFIFVNGYFSKRLIRDGHFQASKVISLFWMYLLFRGAMYGLTCLYKGPYPFVLFKESSGPWYLLSLCCWYLLVPILSNYKARKAIFVSILAALLLGLDSTIGTFFSLSRTITFLPFFCMGYYCNSESLEKIRNKRLRPFSFILIALTITLFYYFGDILSPYRRVIFGASPYSNFLTKDPWYTGIFLRLFWYGCATLLGFAVMNLIPKKKLCFSYVGERTLSIYILHLIIRNILIFEGFFTMLLDLPIRYSLSIFPLSIGIVFLCSMKPIHLFFNFIMRHPFFTGFRRHKKET